MSELLLAFANARDSDSRGGARTSVCDSVGPAARPPSGLRTSRTSTVCPLGAPRAVGSVEKDICVFAMHTGRPGNSLSHLEDTAEAEWDAGRRRGVGGAKRRSFHTRLAVWTL